MEKQGLLRILAFPYLLNLFFRGPRPAGSPTASGPRCRWDGRILGEMIDRIQRHSDLLSDTDWNSRTVVEISAAKKSEGWFFHAITGEEWLLKMKFRTARNTFNREDLVRRLDLKPLNDVPEQKEPWAAVLTKKLDAVHLVLTGPKGRFPLGWLTALGHEPHLDGERPDRDLLRLKFRSTEEIASCNLAGFLKEHLAAARGGG